MQINIFDLNKRERIEKKVIANLVKRVTRKEKYRLNTLNIIIANNHYLRKLNKRFFKKDYPTNVISFHMDNVSEIYVSREKAKDYEELYYYIIHGLLHILGYDHRNQKEELLMENKCRQYLNL